MTDILPPFAAFPKEAKVVGRLLASYGQLEFDLCLCVAHGLGSLDIAIKALFRTRGETQRIDVADAMGRPFYAGHRLDTQFSEMIGGIRHCLKIRNQFSHCYWHDDNSGRLSFVNFEEIAMQNAPVADLSGLTHHYVDAALLQSQERYFAFVSDCLLYLNFEGRKRAGEFASQPQRAPRKVARPPLHIP